MLQYWNDIDSQLELELDVIDDMISEANEVKQFNNWLTYGEPLQRFVLVWTAAVRYDDNVHTYTRTQSYTQSYIQSVYINPRLCDVLFKYLFI